jgi:hypothetical protein
MTELCDLGNKNQTDKATRYWGYTKTYSSWLEPERDRVKAVVEVGIWQGASLRMWRDYFPNAMIVGIDNDMLCQVDGEERIRTFCCDAYGNTKAHGWIRQVLGDVDLFVDDAVHWLPFQTNLLSSMWSHVRDGGVYAIEDCREDNLPAILHAVSCLPNVVRMEMVYAGNYFGTPYSLILLRKGPKTLSVEPR